MQAIHAAANPNCTTRCGWIFANHICKRILACAKRPLQLASQIPAKGHASIFIASSDRRGISPGASLCECTCWPGGNWTTRATSSGTTGHPGMPLPHARPRNIRASHSVLANFNLQAHRDESIGQGEPRNRNPSEAGGSGPNPDWARRRRPTPPPPRRACPPSSAAAAAAAAPTAAEENTRE